MGVRLVTQREPSVEPKRWRADVRFLWPDLHRPGMAMRMASDAGIEAASDDPGALCERVERELAGEAWRYRFVLLIAIATLALPAALLGLWWGTLGLLPIAYEPFSRGLYLPGVSLFEASAYALLSLLLLGAGAHARQSALAMRRLGVDYRRLRDADDTVRQAYAAEAASGEWPRVCALLGRGKEFEVYRPALEAYGQR